MGQPKKDKVDINDYLAIEREDDIRYEYHEGELFAMAGGSINHSSLCNNVAFALTGGARKTGKCVAFNSEMKVEISAGGKYVYPDAGIACPKLKESSDISGAITNPRVVVEVTSPSSGEYDRSNKLRWYFSMPSVKEYVLVSQEEVLVMIYRRHGNGDLYGLQSYNSIDDTIELKSVNIEITLADIYYGVEFPSKAKDERSV